MGIALFCALPPGVGGCTFLCLAFSCGCDITNSCPLWQWHVWWWILYEIRYWYGNTQRRSRPASEKNFDSSFSRAGRLRATPLVLRACNRISKGIRRELQNYNPFAKTWSHRISHVLPKRLTFKAPADTCESSATSVFNEDFVGFHLEHLMFRREPAGPPQVHLRADIKHTVELTSTVISQL